MTYEELVQKMLEENPGQDKAVRHAAKNIIRRHKEQKQEEEDRVSREKREARLCALEKAWGIKR